MPLSFPAIEQRHTLWGRMVSCAPVANRRRADLLAEAYGRVANPPQVSNLPHNLRTILRSGKLSGIGHECLRQARGDLLT
jgi:hypothetical protein